jgi:hypothetical protein
MNAFLQQGVTGTGHVVRTFAIATADLTRQLGQFAHSALTGVVVIGSGHLLGNSAYRELDDQEPLPEVAAFTAPSVERRASTRRPQSLPLNAA